MITDNPQILGIYNAIRDHIKYRTGYAANSIEGNGVNSCHFKYTNSKRVYAGSIGTTDNCIHLSILEDGQTRTVFNGVVYTIDQFFLIDQLTASQT